MLRVSYNASEAFSVSTDQEGENVQNFDNLGDEFVISIYGFKPDTSVKIYSLEEVREELASNNLVSELFYIELNQHYIGIEPLGLTSYETFEVINSIVE